jgi:flagellar biosynthesis/type III secretory pathway protein FliH
MADFCVETIRCEPQLRAEHGVLRSASIAVTSDARLAADRITEAARIDADALLQRAREEAKDVVHKAEQQTLERAAQLLRTLEDAHASLVQHAQDIVVSLAQGAFDCLVSDTTPRERIEAVVKRVKQEAQSGLTNAVLRLHPDDIEHAPEVEWEIKPDATLPRGACRLQASNGEWGADFTAAVSSLKLALDGAAIGEGVDENCSQRDETGDPGVQSSLQIVDENADGADPSNERNERPRDVPHKEISGMAGTDIRARPLR